MLEQKLSKIEAVLMFEDEDFEQVTGVKKQEDLDGDEGRLNRNATAGNDPTQPSSSNADGAPVGDPEANDAQQETAEQKFERQVLEVEAAWRDTFRDAQFYIDELRQEIFEPSAEWTNWQETKDYTVKVSNRQSNPSYYFVSFVDSLV